MFQIIRQYVDVLKLNKCLLHVVNLKQFFFQIKIESQTKVFFSTINCKTWRRSKLFNINDFNSVLFISCFVCTTTNNTKWSSRNKIQIKYQNSYSRINHRLSNDFTEIIEIRKRCRSLFIVIEFCCIGI